MMMFMGMGFVPSKSWRHTAASRAILPLKTRAKTQVKTAVKTAAKTAARKVDERQR
jgi:hypothetical protein